MIAQKEAAVGDNVRYKVLPLRYENGNLSFLNSGSGRYYVIEEAQCIGIHRVSSLLLKKDRLRFALHHIQSIYRVGQAQIDW